jgi:antitoxin MazE
MQTKIQKWGNSLAVRLPKDIATKKGLKVGSSVVLALKNNQITIDSVDAVPTLNSLLAAVDKNNIHQESDWSEIRGNEVW